MRIENLPSVGILSNGLRLQTEAMKAISNIEMQAGYNGGKATGAKRLSDFFDACKAAIASFVDTVAPTVLSRSVRVGGAHQAIRVDIRHSEALDPVYQPTVASFAVSGKTVTAARIDGPDVILSVSVPFTNGQTATVSYTQPGGDGNLRDLSGNLLANYTTQAIVNGVPA